MANFMIAQQLKLQALGVINLALPIVILAQFYPMQESLKIICSLMIGLYIVYLNYKTAKAQVEQLRFEPTDTNKIALEQIIQACNFNPAKIILRYGFTNEMVATTTFNTIVLDPLLWSIIETDPKAEEACTVINQFIMPQLTQQQKERIPRIRAILSESAQKFILRHELAHVRDSYSHKKIALMGVIAMIATYSGITVALALARYMPGIGALLLGLIIGGLLDLLCSQASNYFFKLRAEQKADLFACAQSTQEEILAAAQFFEKFHEITSPTQPIGFWARIPHSVLTGYLSGSDRSAYLKKTALSKHY